MNKFIAFVFVLLVFPSHRADAQTAARPFQAAVLVAFARSGEFESSELGLGGRLSWNPLAALGLESEINLYPEDFPDRPAFSGSRLEGLFGVTVGPRFARARPFARLRAGFLRFSAAPAPFACIAIFPPPLSCLMASGGTRPALDLGGGVEVYTGGRAFVRVDAGDRMVRYPGPSFGEGLTLRDSGFFSHDLRFAVGGGVKF